MRSNLTSRRNCTRHCRGFTLYLSKTYDDVASTGMLLFNHVKCISIFGSFLLLGKKNIGKFSSYKQCHWSVVIKKVVFVNQQSIKLQSGGTLANTSTLKLAWMHRVRCIKRVYIVYLKLVVNDVFYRHGWGQCTIDDELKHMLQVVELLRSGESKTSGVYWQKRI